MPEQLAYRPREVWTTLGISRSKFFQLCKAGKIETRKVGSITIVPADSLRRFLDNLPRANAA